MVEKEMLKMSEGSEILMVTVLSSTVFASLITSLTNLIVTLINNRRIKNNEKQKNMTEIDKYRYVHLYEMLLNWHNYDSDFEGESPGEIAFNRLLNGFLDDVGRYEIIRPLLDEQFISGLDKLKDIGNKLLCDLIDTEKPDGTHTKNFISIKDQYFENGSEFSDELKEVINKQLKILLMKS